MGEPKSKIEKKRGEKKEIEKEIERNRRKSG